MLTFTEESTLKLKEMILDGNFQPGQTLPQRKIAELLGVSPIVVRESFRMLEKEGLVDIIPKWGSRVVGFNPEKLRGQYLSREALEGMAARIVSEKATDEEIENLYLLADGVDRLFEDPASDRKEMAREHYQFHLSIIRLTGCPEIIETVERINMQQLIWFNSQIVDLKKVPAPPRWHRKIVAVLAQRNPEEAENLMRVHVRRGFKDIINSLGNKNRSLK